MSIYIYYACIGVIGFSGKQRANTYRMITTNSESNIARVYCVEQCLVETLIEF